MVFGTATPPPPQAVCLANGRRMGKPHPETGCISHCAPLRYLESHHISQLWWSSIVSLSTRNRMVSSVRAKYKFRLQHRLDPCSGAWLPPIPSVSLGMSFAPPEFQVLLRWWLGLPQRQTPREGDTGPRCGDAMDPFGDHAVCCRLKNFYMRQNMVADAVSRVLAGAGVHTDRDLTVAGKERPADLLAHGISSSAPVALDITVVHTLSKFDTGHNNSRVFDAEKEKHEHYDAVCASAGLSFKAFGLSTFCGAGPDAKEIMNTISAKMVSKSGQQEGNFLARAARERIIVACIRGVGAQLRSTFHMEEDDPVPQECAETQCQQTCFGTVRALLYKTSRKCIVHPPTAWNHECNISRFPHSLSLCA